MTALTSHPSVVGSGRERALAELLREVVPRGLEVLMALASPDRILQPGRSGRARRYSQGVNLVDELHAIARALREAGIRYAICGGIAVTIHGAVRTTKDIDLLVAPEDVPAILEIVRVLGYTFAALPMTFDAGTPRERHVQRVTKLEAGGHIILDLIAADAAFDGLLAERLEVELPEGPLAVVTRDVLIRMKRIAGRAQDLADIAALEHVDEEA